ncbi:hypothetical protein A3F37_01715 [Candidatus Saccharibacteria bacterium RIFCSPHIGHO2_12_FULL_41_12]|nr:MAG: hypothetical protein A3F37_01715 [Candidatus Saccharibacteria bacterium RIFCSPHIGHO2_12_FULL_41_12]
MNKKSLINYYGISTLISLVLIGLVGLKLGMSALILTLILVALEITFSFDNAVINAKILKDMSRSWQRAFIWLGIPIAVFGVRILLPLLVVSMVTGSNIADMTNLALNNPEEYALKINDVRYMIYSFGGVFLMMLALDFFFEHKKVRWLKKVETIMMKAGTMEGLTVMISIFALLLATNLVDSEHKTDVLISGMVGMFVYLLIRAMNILLARSNIRGKAKSGLNNTFKAGLVGFIYLQVVDASFSMDSVIGAFAITQAIIIIAIGLGIGAIYVRSMTIHMLRSNALENYKYMEHGAHYAIGILAIIMFLNLKYEIPEYITGLSGVVVITASVFYSVKEKRIKPAKW